MSEPGKVVPGGRNGKALIRNEIEEMMRKHFGENVDMGSSSGVITTLPPPPKLNTLNKFILERIFVNMTNKFDYMPEKSRWEHRGGKKKMKFASQDEAMTMDFWKLACVCNSFHTYLSNLSDSELAKYPRPTIGLRIIQPNVSLALACINEPQKVVMYPYGYFSKRNAALCASWTNISSVLYPAVIQTNLVVQGFVLDDDVVEMLKNLDTSQVEEVYFNDIKGVELKQYSIPDIVNLFPNAMEIRFLGDERFTSLAQLSVEVPNMEKTDLEDIPHGKLACMYHDVDHSEQKRNKLVRNRHILLRETALLEDKQPAKNEESEPYHKSLKRLANFLDEPPKKKDPEIKSEIAELEKKLKALRSRS